MLQARQTCVAGRVRASKSRTCAVIRVQAGGSTQGAGAQSTIASLAKRAASVALSTTLSLSILATGAAGARPERVNRPDLLPQGAVTPLIDVAGFLAPSEEKRIIATVGALERDTGFKLRVLAQNYPETPGLAVRDYWQVDDSTVVLVADPSFGSILNTNVGAGVDLEVPQSFWGRLSGKFGNKFYWTQNGEAASIMQAVNAIDLCLREPSGRSKCSEVRGAPEIEAAASESGGGGLLGGFFGR